MQFELNYWIFQTIAMLVTALILPGLSINSIFGAVLSVVALSFVNAHLWSAALFFQIPDSFTVQAITTLLANGVIFWILVKILPGISVEGFLPAIAAPVVFTISSILIRTYGSEVDWAAALQQFISFIKYLQVQLVGTPLEVTVPTDSHTLLFPFRWLQRCALVFSSTV